tara:strand:- start:288 stop:749 length:462 start_codon:yes stop_codon:yes gene_type:complete
MAKAKEPIPKSTPRASYKTAANKGLGGGLLLGFSTCKLETVVAGKAVAPDPGTTYVAPLHRLRGVYQAASPEEAVFFFEPLGGNIFTGSDVIQLGIPAQYTEVFWINVANIMGGRAAGDTFVWVYNACATDDLGLPQVIPNVDSIKITLAQVV